MIYILLLTIPITANINFPSSKVLDTAEQILSEWQIPICERETNQLTTEKMEIDISLLNNYIIEDLPADNPGWTKGRFTLVINVESIGKKRSKLTIEALIERYGTESVMLLIPPIWRPVPSNGKMEQEFIDEIIKRLTDEEER